MIGEPHIIINGTPLTTAQAMTVRVALTCYLMEIADDGALGSDRNGEAIRQGYLKAGREIGLLMAGKT
ncbi:hypothetical protein [Rhizobium arsenicireducens]